MMQPHAVFRTDASVTGGLGHLMRCRALAGEWMAQGGYVTFLTTHTPDHLLAPLGKAGCKVEVGPSGCSVEAELSWICEVLKALPSAVAFLDGYDFGLEYQRRLRPLVPCLVCLDDVPGRPFACDVLLNQNVGVAALDYERSVDTGTTLLLGPRYALVREDYQAHAGEYRVSERPSRLLVSMGGADPGDQTMRMLSELAGLPDVELDVILGSLYQHPDPIDRVSGLDPHCIQVHRGLDSLVDVALRVDLAVTAAGSTVWEFACLGVPMAVLGTAENQNRVLQGLQAEDAALVLGRAESVLPGMITKAVGSLLTNPTRLQGLSRSATRLVDGKGSQRVVDTVRKMFARTVRQNLVAAEPERGVV